MLYAGRGGGIRTPGPLLPKQMRYQAALRPDSSIVTRTGFVVAGGRDSLEETPELQVGCESTANPDNESQQQQQRNGENQTERTSQ